ncbi:MAG: FAD-dependent oxidoreductase, partial [Planctomycetota bacterium]
YTKDLDHPVEYTPPSFALKDVTDIPRYRQFNAEKQGCQLWWIEYGGRLDTVHDTEEIKWELWRVIYGVWNHIKNSGQFPEAANKTLEWVGTVPGKRESRRFEGDVMLTQPDVIEQRRFEDAVAFGGWAIDLHPADGVFSEKPGCNQYHSIGTYQIPYRSLYSRNIKNLFLGGRTMSASHVAFGSTRVMATTSHMGQAIGHAAAVCARHGVLPREVSSGTHLAELQRDLLRSTQHIPAVPLDDGDDLVGNATLSTSSSFKLGGLPASDDWLKVEDPQAMLLPLKAGAMPSVAIEARAAKSTEMRAELRVCSRPGSFTPDTTLEQITVPVAAGDGGAVTLSFESQLPRDAHVFVCVFPADGLELRLSDRRVTGVMRVQCRPNKAVSAGAQTDMEHLGVDAFDFWCPERRPGGQNLAMRLDPPVAGFSKDELTTGVFRPCDRSNAWVADPSDARPTLLVEWSEHQTIRRVDLHFDTDFDNPLESVLLGHHDSISPFVVRQFRLVGIDADGNEHTLGEADDNSASHVILLPDVAVDLRQLRLELTHPSTDVPAALFGIRCYADPNAGPIRRHPGRSD